MDDVLAHEIGTRIRRYRTAHPGSSLRDVAARAGVTAAMLSNYETGNAVPSLDSLFKLAIAINLTPGKLLPTLTKLKRTALRHSRNGQAPPRLHRRQLATPP